jgi:muramidase (phage lysozyme)
VIGQMAKGTFKANPTKKSFKADGKCYQYVRIALTRAQIVNGYLAESMALPIQESASKAGPALLIKGFTDVTDEVPDARWAATGDIIVYEWSQFTWDANKKDKKNPSYPNHGHIDIRSESSYLSDHIPDKDRPRWIRSRDKGYTANYINIRIFRKFYDPLPTCRIRAFLRCLREYECQAISKDEDRYQALHKPLPTAPQSKSFSDYSTHPWEKIPPAQRGTETAAGAYQFVYTTWREHIDRGYFPDLDSKALFTPAGQDRVAVLALELCGALPPLRRGDLVAAVNAAKGVWVSLPGGTQNSHRRANGRAMDMDYLSGIFAKYLAEEKMAFGVP